MAAGGGCGGITASACCHPFRAGRGQNGIGSQSYGRPLFNSVEDERFPVPVIMPLCLTGDDISEVTFENFGKEVRLYLWERNAA